jgi:hypothetical protein
MLRMMSVTSSATPLMVSNSWRASSKRTVVIAAPGIEESRVRRGVAERVAEAGLERTDRELLLVVRGLAEGFDGGALHDEHVAAGPFFCIRVREEVDECGRGGY